ncbi:MAG: guanylate kinase [Bacillota bacterium]
MHKGLLIVISGPSGVGKGVICRCLLNQRPELKVSVSATTRAMREGETEGVNYFFKSKDEFKRMIADNAFLEYTEIFGSHYYGTPHAYVQEQQCLGNDVILEIDVQGAMSVKKRCPDAVFIFIAPPSMSTLRCRLVGRGTESPEAVQRRFDTAFKEMKWIGEYDYIVVNDVLEDAVKQIDSIVTAEKLRVQRNEILIQRLQEGEML